jgi:hypothetical protein
MKTKLIILSISVIAIGIMSRCGCHSCLAGGESFDLPYSSNQTITFINDSQDKKEFLVETTLNLPPDEYCGHIGSESYRQCNGGSSAKIKSTNDNSTLITINYSTSGNDDVELQIYKVIVVAESTLLIWQDIASTSDPNGVAQSVENITINGIQYNNVYVYQNDSATVNNCSYFVYSMTDGIIKYTIKKDNSLENWTLTK